MVGLVVPDGLTSVATGMTVEICQVTVIGVTGTLRTITPFSRSPDEDITRDIMLPESSVFSSR